MYHSSLYQNKFTTHIISSVFYSLQNSGGFVIFFEKATLISLYFFLFSLELG